MEPLMKTYSNFGELLKTQLQSDPVVKLSKKWFTKETVKLLNQNLSFVPAQTDLSDTTLDKELDDFYRRIELKSLF